MSLKLYTYPNNYRANKALIAAEYNGVKIELPPVEMGVTNKSDWFLKLNPLGKIPTLETPEGGIFESNSIARYVARMRLDTGIYGRTFYESVQVDQWLDWMSNEVEPARGIWLYPIFGYLQYHPKAYADAKKDIEKALAVLNTHLLNNTYLVGNQITLADICVVSALVDMYRMVFTPAFTKPFGNVARWFNTCINQPQFSKVIGKVEFAKTEQLAPGAAPAKEETKPAAAAAAPKAEAKKDENADLLDELEKPKKQVSALDSLPPSNMILDVVKKLAFSQPPFKTTFFEELFGGIWDNEGYSVYIATYNYNDENKVYFMTQNLVSGFLQRCDACRKYCMGTMFIAGNADEETPPFKVAGAFIFRGPEVPKVEMLEENPDSEYYTWTKLDVSTDAGKAKIKELFMSESYEGEPILERKYFK